VSQERQRLVQLAVGLWNERDISRLTELLDPAVELESPFSSVAGEPYRGHAGIEQWIADIDQQFAEWEITLHELRHVGDRVIAVGSVEARGRGSDVSLQVPAATVCEFGADDRFTHLHIYLDVEQALGEASRGRASGESRAVTERPAEERS